jgi:hypothetical protein
MRRPNGSTTGETRATTYGRDFAVDLLQIQQPLFYGTIVCCGRPRQPAALASMKEG